MSHSINNNGKSQSPRRPRGPMGGGPMGRFSREKAKDFKGAMVKLIRYIGRYKGIIIFSIIIASIATAANIVGPKILGKATTRLFEGLLASIQGTGSVDFDYIGRILLITLALYVSSAILRYIQGWIMAKVSTNIAYQLRRDISEKINRMKLKYYDTTTYGEVLSRLTNDVDAINQTLSQSLTQIITSIITVIGILVMMFTINWMMALLVITIVPLSGMSVLFIIKRSQKHFAQQQEYLGHVNSHVEEMFGNHNIVKAYNGEEKSIETFDGYNRTLYKSAWKSQFYSGMTMPLMTFIGNIGYVGVAILGGYLSSQGKLSVGDIQAFIQYVRSFTQPLGQIASASNVLQQTAAAAERVFGFLEESEEVDDSESSSKLENITGLVEFKNVKFGYYSDKTVIHNFSAIAKPGQKIALVGPTGAGKTTLVKLLMRFYDINEGAIMLDGIDIRNVTRKNLRENFGMVLQDTWLFNGTIMENIRYGRQDASDKEVIVAAKAAYVDKFVYALPGGYDMEINEEVTNLSQGQMQLMTIARAVLADPKILILDEATSSVDTRTEILIQRAMDDLMKNRTSFVIAHRLSTIRNADLILVINDGDIVEQGTHTELLEKNGFYADLYNSQFIIEEMNNNSLKEDLSK
ncbi:MAG TPA: ABC transporter ATP-binding protein [candidate division Zixibacteria bacterium]|nr:ABC transporter ATP-binding protein [candidate division Zixibacteria bacterium]